MRHGTGRTLLRAVVAVVMGITGLTVREAVDPTTAGAACASTFKQRLGGSVQGEDGRYISALIGISLFRADGTRIAMDGCPITTPGYTTHVKVNTVGDTNPLYLLSG